VGRSIHRRLHVCRDAQKLPAGPALPVRFLRPTRPAPLQQTRRTHLELYVRQLEQQLPRLSNATLYRRISTLSSWFTWLEDEELTRRQSRRRVRRPSRHPRPQPWLERNELADLLTTARTRRSIRSSPAARMAHCCSTKASGGCSGTTPQRSSVAWPSQLASLVGSPRTHCGAPPSRSGSCRRIPAGDATRRLPRQSRHHGRLRPIRTSFQRIRPSCSWPSPPADLALQPLLRWLSARLRCLLRGCRGALGHCPQASLDGDVT
jgi:hypothetical protein